MADTPHQRMMLAKQLMADQFNKPTPQDYPVVERSSLLPLATYGNGQTGLAWPGMIAEDIPNALTAPARAYRGELGDYLENRDAYLSEGLNFAGTAAVGGSVVPKPTNAAGVFGGDLPHGIKAKRQTNTMGQTNYTLTDETAGAPVGSAYVRDLGDNAQVGRVSIADDYQRQGIGTALYGQIESDLGKKLVPDETLSPKAYSFWMKHHPERVGDYTPPSSPDGFYVKSREAATGTGSGDPVALQALLDSIEGNGTTFGANSRNSTLPGTILSEAGRHNRLLDPLGYYSQALETARGLKQAKGTPEQMLAQLKSAGVKDAEIEATGLRSLLDGKKSVTRDEIVAHLEGNRVGLNEVVRSREGNASALLDFFGGRSSDVKAAPPKWADYSLDPSNPTYRETVLHLPNAKDTPEARALAERAKRGEITPQEYEEAYRKVQAAKPDFQSGHFDEPNIVGHMMTSMTKHEGKPVYTIDQIQSDWGQKLRDNGVRDEAVIAERKRQVGVARQAVEEYAVVASRKLDDLGVAKSPFGDDPDMIAENLRDRLDAVVLQYRKAERRGDSAEIGRLAGLASESDAILKRLDELESTESRLVAEMHTAQESAPGHPLVNTTDQWVNTTLRRGLKQAVDDGADYIAIPSGETVLSYNPGDAHGMGEFYGKIVPKNLGNMLRRFDKSAVPLHVNQLETPGKSMAGNGFTLFPITDLVRAEVNKGLPLFANSRPSSLPGTLLSEAADQAPIGARVKALAKALQE